MDEIKKQFDWFADDGIFMPMLNDNGRNQFYKDAIARSVRGKVVADVGAGTGALSILSAKHGAKKIFAVEKDNGRYQYLCEMMDRLGLKGIVEVINSNFLDTDISADIYVSETINTQIFGEGILNIANHAVKYGGTFIPSSFEITPVIFKDHPIFIIDQTHSDAFEFDSEVDIDEVYRQIINKDFRDRHPLADTLYRANQLNKIFQMLPRFNDLKIEKIWEGPPLLVDLNNPIDIDCIRLIIDPNDIPNQDHDWYLVLFWKARYQDIVMDCKEVWFGNVSKLMRKIHRQPDRDITIWYDDFIKDWRVTF
jgi:predicted RNA methylase